MPVLRVHKEISEMLKMFVRKDTSKEFTKRFCKNVKIVYLRFCLENVENAPVEMTLQKNSQRDFVKNVKIVLLK